LIWGWHLDLTPSSKTIGLAYANGVRTFGAQPLADPGNDFYSYLYTDQGKDYRAKEWDGKPLFFKNAARVDGGLQMICSHRRVGFFAETGIQHIMARGYNAKEKPVERVHKDISFWEKNTFLRDGYCGKSPDDKPDEWHDAYARHKKLQKKFGKNVHTLLEESPFFTLDEYREGLAGWIHEHNTMEHRRSVLGGQKIVPVDELQRLYSPVEISEEALALLLMKVEKRKIGKNGVNLFRPNWWFLHQEMSEHKGEEIEIRYSDDDYTRVWAILPATKIKPVRIVESVLITPSSIRNPNKRSNEAVNFQKRYDKDLVKNFALLNHSIIRGETAEDRVAAALEPPEEVEVKQVAAGGSLRQLTRFDAPRIPANNRSTLSTETITNAKVLDMFPAQKPKKRIKEEWE
jgi:hypothetical protein